MAQVVFVSKSQLRFTLQRLNTDKKESEIVKQFDDYLTEFQLDHIFKINGLKEHFNQFNIVQLRPLVRDDLSMIFPDKHSRYHLSEDCSASRSNYINGHIPEEFRNPIDAQQYRAWFKEIQEKIERNGEISQDTYRLLHKSRWGFAYKGRLVSGINRGTEELKSFTKRELIAEAFKIRTRIDQQIIEELNQGKNTTLSYLPKYAKIKSNQTESEEFKRLVTSNGDDYSSVNKWLADYRNNYQYPLANTFKLLFMMKHFPDSSLEINLAKALGFVPCKVCAGKNKYE